MDVFCQSGVQGARKESMTLISSGTEIPLPLSSLRVGQSVNQSVPAKGEYMLSEYISKHFKINLELKRRFEGHLQSPRNPGISSSQPTHRHLGKREPVPSSLRQLRSRSRYRNHSRLNSQHQAEIRGPDDKTRDGEGPGPIRQGPGQP